MTFNLGIISSIHSPKYHPELMSIPTSLCHTLKVDCQEQRYYHQPLGNDTENKVKITFFGNERKLGQHNTLSGYNDGGWTINLQRPFLTNLLKSQWDCLLSDTFPSEILIYQDFTRAQGKYEPRSLNFSFLELSLLPCSRVEDRMKTKRTHLK